MSPKPQMEGPVIDTKSGKIKTEKWIRMGDRQYNISDFKHPGGSIINFLEASHTEASDATDVFNNFHFRSTKAKKMLKTLETKPYIVTKPDPDQAMLEDFRKLTQDLIKEGYFDGSYMHFFYRFFEIVAIYLVGTVLFAAGWKKVGASFWGLGMGRSGWLMHEGGHCSLTGILWVDKRIQEFMMGFGALCSGRAWNSLHNRHHATPQKIKHDCDLATLPLVAFFHGAEVGPVKFFNRWWMRLQAYTFLPLTSGLIVISFWSFVKDPLHCIKHGWWVQLFWMVAGHVARYWAMTNYLLPEASPVWAYLWACTIPSWFGGIYIFGHFSTSHTHLPVIDSDQTKNWVRYAIEHTVDISPQNDAVNWIMGYLNCQTLHHLWPQMPQYHQPEVSRRFEKFCKKWDLDYQITGYFEAMWTTFKNLDDVGIAYWNDEKVKNH